MQYLGGKSRIRKQVAGYLESIRKPEQVYFEPFVGGAWVLQEMSGKRIASDGNFALIEMYKALQCGWVPPDTITKEQYKEYKEKQDPRDPMTAFVGIGCSFAGKWFGGFIGNGEKAKCSVKASRGSLLKQLPAILDCDFIHGTFDVHSVGDGWLVYCDPPYQGTTAYGAFSGFDHDKFWGTVRSWSKHNTVIVSEYAAPSDFECVQDIEKKNCMRHTGGVQKVEREKLFRLKTTT